MNRSAPQFRITQLPALTGVRGIGALWVFVHHWNAFQFRTGEGPHFLAIGYLGVDMFFMLSGFIMANSRYDYFARVSPRRYRDFMLERILRLYPTNAGVMVLYVLAVWAVPSIIAAAPAQEYAARNFFASLLFLESWLVYPLGTWIAPGWSVSVEMAAYLALPAVIWVLRQLPGPRTALVLSAFSLAAFVGILIAHGEHDPNVTWHGGFLRVGCEFTAGAAMFAAWRSGAHISGAAATLLIALLLTGAAIIQVREGAFLALPAFLLAIPVAADQATALARLLSGRVMMFFGRISYSLYLVHWPALVFWRHFGGLARPLFINMMFFAVTIGLATAVHYCFEAPSHMFARSFSRR